MKYVKKPVVIDAITFDELAAMGAGYVIYNGHTLIKEDGHYLIPTLEGTMRFSPGEMLITGIVGEVYPCRMDIFNATYTEVLGETT